MADELEMRSNTRRPRRAGRAPRREERYRRSQGQSEALSRVPFYRRWWPGPDDLSVPVVALSAPRIGSHQMPTVGRDRELRWLEYNLANGIDTVLLGPHGVGKSHLLAALRGERMVRIDELWPVRCALLQIAMQLHAAGLCLADPGPDWQRPRRRTPPPAGPVLSPEQFRRRHDRTSAEVLTRMVLSAVPRGKWTLVIDDLDHVTPTANDLLDQLASRFVVMTAVEQVRSRHRGRFRRFDRIPVPPLSRPAAQCLVRLATEGVEVESPRFLENHLAFRTGGHPGAILGCIDYLRRAEPAITCQAVRDLPLEFFGPQKYIDLTPAFALVAFFLIAYRFLSLGLEDEELYMVTGVGWAVFMAVRRFLRRASYRR